MIAKDEHPVSTLPPVPLMLGVAAAAAVSVALVWLSTPESAVALAYGGALVTVLLMLLVIARLKSPPAEAQIAQTDWSITSAAMENRRRAIAIIDRANRLVCANSSIYFCGPSGHHRNKTSESTNQDGEFYELRHFNSLTGACQVWIK